MMSDSFAMVPIAEVVSPYKQKFAIPRQPGLVKQAKGRLVMLPPCDTEEYIRGVEQMSHIWVVFVFHEHLDAKPRSLIRPPRLGGNKKIGVFASRSTYRPNPIGLSVLSLRGVSQRGGQWCIEVEGLDLLDGTPILDIKPYIPYADSIPHASAGYATEAPTAVLVSFAASVVAAIEHVQRVLDKRKEDVVFRELVQAVLEQDPRPAYKKGQDEGARYGMTLYDWEVKWEVQHGAFVVVSIE